VEKHAGGPGGALLEFPLNFFHMGVHTQLVQRLSVVLALAFLGLLGLVTEERNRFRDSEPGALLLFFWAAAGWALVAAVHQPAPRYLFPLVTPLLYFATRPLLRLWEGRDFFLRLPKGAARTVLAAGVLFLGLYQLLGVFGAGVLDSLGASERGRFVYDFFVRRDEYTELVPFVLSGTAILCAVSLALLAAFRNAFPLRVPLSPARGKAAAALLVLASVALDIAPWAAWRAHATHYLRDASRDIGDWLGPEAKLMGPYAPALGLDNRIRVIPYTGAPGETDVYRKYGVTHVVAASPADDAMIRERDPAIHAALEMVLYYPIRTKYSDRMVVYRVPRSVGDEPIHDYRPGPFERGMDALKREDPEEALRLFREFAEERPWNADGRHMIAVVLDRLGRRDEAAEAAREAAALRPERGLYPQTLGAIEARRGRTRRPGP
jgi:tetratricopeptide (TPR) repeat protein